MKVNKSLRNIFSLGLLQGFNYLLPLFSVPYLLIVLGAEGNGYLITSQAIVSYLSLLIEYGFVLTASKKVALSKGRDDLQKSFSAVFICKTILLIITFLILLIIGTLLDDKVLFYCILIGLLQIVGLFFNPVWLFQGTENADLLAKVNIIVRTIFYGLIFIFVHTSADLYKAVFLLSVPHFIVGILCYYKAKKFFQIKIVKVPRLDVWKEFTEGFYGFWITLMNFTYTSAGILFLGVFSSQEVVGIYGTIEKLVRAGIQVFNPIIHGLYPKVLRLHNEHKTKEFKKLLYSCYSLSLVIGIGVVILSPIISKLFLVELSNDYSINTLRILSVWFSLNTISVVTGIWIFFSKDKMEIYTKIYTIATIICLILHLIFIPLLGAVVVPINLVIGEVFILILFYFVLKRGIA